MNESLLEAYYQKRGFSENELKEALNVIKTAESHFADKEMTFGSATVDDVRAYVHEMRPLELNALLAMARYFYLIGQNEIYIYFTALLGGRGVLENIISSLEACEGKEVSDRILEGFELPPLGTEPTELPRFTAQFVTQLEANLPEAVLHKVLAGNNHGIPEDAFLKEKEIYEAAESLDAYLADYQRRQIQVLQEHCDQKKVWFEQTITQEVVDFAASNQEIMSAVRVGNTLYATKIPYDSVHYLQETDPKMKRYYACHCPFAREAILDDAVQISPNWCYCSGGFAKFPYDVILGRPLRVELIDSVLKGDDLCRFAVHLD